MSSKKKGKSKIDSKINRHRRRVRNVILAYFIALIMIAAIGAGVFFGVRAVGGAITEKKEELVAEQEEMAAEIAARQESIEAEEAERIAALEAEAQASIEAEAMVETETEPESISNEDVLEEIVQTYIETMTLEEKVAGLFIITPEALTKSDKVIKAGDGTKEALEKYPVGGLIYFAQNIQSADQVKEMLGNTVSFSKYPLFLCVDEEVGDVNRLRKTLKLDGIDSAKKIAETGDANQAYEAYKTIGDYLLEYGFNVDLAPVADLNVEGVTSVIGDRSFGTDTALVSSMVESSIRGLGDAGVVSCLKHFPGQGAADADTHKGMATSDRTYEEFKENELEIFSKGIEAGADMIMVGHFIAPALTGDESTPCSLSKDVMTDLLRGEYQYDGIIITDALAMSAVADYYGSGEAAIKALKAGADVLLMPENFEEAYTAVVEAVQDGTISEQRINDSLARVYKIKYRSTVE